LKTEDTCTERLDKELVFKEIGPDCFQVEPFDSNGAQCLGFDGAELVFADCSENTHWTSKLDADECNVYTTTTTTFAYIPAVEANESAPTGEEESDEHHEEKHEESREEESTSSTSQEPTTSTEPLWKSFTGFNMILKSINNLCLRLADDGQILESASCNTTDKQQQFVATGMVEPDGDTYAENVTSMYNGKILCFDGNANTIVASDNCEKSYHEILIRPLQAGSHCFHVVFKATTEIERQQNNGIQPSFRCMTNPSANPGQEEMVTTPEACDEDGALWQRYGDPEITEFNHWNAC
jgi:hypothetical protein